MADNERPEQEWVRLAQEGDRNAFAVLVRRHQDRIYRHLLQLTGSREEALELAQETFIKAWQALADWRPEAQFHTWLYRIASNLALDLLRRRQVVQFVPLQEDHDLPAESAGPQARLEATQQMRALEAALGRLTPDQRQIILLREVEGLSYEEISAAMQLDEGTVKSRLARARAALAAIYDRNPK